MNIPTENLLSLVNGFTFVRRSITNQDISQGTQSAHKGMGYNLDAEVKELNVMKNALCWDVNFGKEEVKCKQLPSTTLERHCSEHAASCKEEHNKPGYEVRLNVLLYSHDYYCCSLLYQC